MRQRCPVTVFQEGNETCGEPADFWATSPCAPMLARAVTSVLRAHLYRSCHSGSGLCLYVVADQAMRMCI